MLAVSGSSFSVLHASTPSFWASIRPAGSGPASEAGGFQRLGPFRLLHKVEPLVVLQRLPNEVTDALASSAGRNRLFTNSSIRAGPQPLHSKKSQR